ncbi:hypothetical protein GUJ93_ZPchr0011g28834 [Zizania palustris]|uniref:Uncharacterized protein n=1 Tax=Zizania palustris TaxID=103762 RepID=A0A8J5WK96_ZIZPA|nr:hypothetical protein GUJ93_ZPchr0011g28834 [Zizania palustris]
MGMASRASGLIRAAAARGAKMRAAATSPSLASMPARSVATAADAVHQYGAATKAKRPVGDYVPVYVALGVIAVSVALGLDTARQQLAHAPNVRLDKKKRETIPEVAAPDMALDEAERFVRGSLLRKVARVQDDRSLRAGLAADYPAAARKAVTLKDAGVEPPGIERGGQGHQHGRLN